MPSEEKIAFTRSQKILRALSILSIVGGVSAFLLFSSLLAVSFMLSVEELAEVLGVSTESARIHITLSFSLPILTGILSIARGIVGIRSRRHPLALIAFVTIAEVCVAIHAVEVIWSFAQGNLAQTADVLLSLAGIALDSFMVAVGLWCRREMLGNEELAQVAETHRLMKERRKLGFIRLLQVYYALNIIFSFTMLVFVTRDEMVYSYITVVDWINLTFHVVCFYLIWKRLRIARNAIILLSIVNMVLNTVNYLFFDHIDIALFIFEILVDVLVILYFLFSKRPKEALVNELSHEHRIDANGGDFIARKGWPRWRNLILYYCVFSVLGHWMELGFCMLIRAGIVAGEYDPTNTMLWRDLLFPFPMEGIAVVICALWLYPLKNWFIEKVRVRFVPLFLSFLVNGAVCTLMELAGGLMVNADHSLWDYSDMFCNFMGQICLQNAIGFGLACTLITWVVYPLLERSIARIPGDTMNVVFVGCLAFNLILQTLYLVEPAEIANAFTIWGQALSGNAAGAFFGLLL